MPANIAEEISAEKVVALEGSESDLEKFDESDSEDAHALEKGTLEEGALEEGALEGGALEEGASVGKSDEQVEGFTISEEQRRQTEAYLRYYWS